MLQYTDFNHKGVLIQIDDVPDALTDIRANTPFEWQDTADDRFVFVCVERKIVEVFDTTGKLAGNDIRTAYIGQEVNERFYEWNPVLRYLSYVEFDPKDEDVISPYIRKSDAADCILETAQSLTSRDGQELLPDIYADTFHDNFKFFVSDNYSEDSDTCLEANVYYIIGGGYDYFMPPGMKYADYWGEVRGEYFAPYRIEWLLDECDNDEEAEHIQKVLDDGTMERAQEIYGVVLNHLGTYSTRMMLERGVFILLKEPYCAALDGCGKSNAQNYLAYAIHKYLQNPTEYGSNNEVYNIDDYEEALCVQLKALKEYFGEKSGFEWIKEVPSEHTQFMPTLKRLSETLGNDYQVSPMEELESEVKRWANDIHNIELFK